MGMVMYLRRAKLAQIEQLASDPSGWEAFAFEQGDQEADLVDFDKAWHALHFILTGAAYNTPSPLGVIVNDAATYGTDENGFGGFSVITPEQMTAFDRELRAIDDATLATRFDPAAMVAEDIYLADVFAEEGEEALEYIFQGLPALRSFSASCAAAGDGALRILA